MIKGSKKASCKLRHLQLKTTLGAARESTKNKIFVLCKHIFEPGVRFLVPILFSSLFLSRREIRGDAAMKGLKIRKRRFQRKKKRKMLHP